MPLCREQTSARMSTMKMPGHFPMTAILLNIALVPKDSKEGAVGEVAEMLLEHGLEE